MTRRTPNKSARGVPHFLRVTQALAFVSGAGAPSAAMLVATADGRPMGVMPLPGDAASDRSFPGIQIPPDAALLDGGGPLLPPELAA